MGLPQADPTHTHTYTPVSSLSPVTLQACCSLLQLPVAKPSNQTGRIIGGSHQHANVHWHAIVKQNVSACTCMLEILLQIKRIMLATLFLSAVGKGALDHTFGVY